MPIYIDHILYPTLTVSQIYHPFNIILRTLNKNQNTHLSSLVLSATGTPRAFINWLQILFINANHFWIFPINRKQTEKIENLGKLFWNARLKKPV